MKKYLTCWMFLDMGMEGIPSMDTPLIVEAQDYNEANLKGPYFKHGYGSSVVIGEIENGELKVVEANPRCNDWTVPSNKEYCDAVKQLYQDALTNTYEYDKRSTFIQRQLLKLKNLIQKEWI